jgi:hypothetical protein
MKTLSFPVLFLCVKDALNKRKTLKTIQKHTVMKRMLSVTQHVWRQCSVMLLPFNEKWGLIEKFRISGRIGKRFWENVKCTVFSNCYWLKDARTLKDRPWKSFACVPLRATTWHSKIIFFCSEFSHFCWWLCAVRLWIPSDFYCNTL